MTEEETLVRTLPPRIDNERAGRKHRRGNAPLVRTTILGRAAMRHRAVATFFNAPVKTEH